MYVCAFVVGNPREPGIRNDQKSHLRSTFMEAPARGRPRHMLGFGFRYGLDRVECVVQKSSIGDQPNCEEQLLSRRRDGTIQLLDYVGLW